MHLDRARLEQELHELARGRPADDRVVDDHHPPAVECRAQRVELELDAALAEALVGLDERPADVAVLDEPLAVRDAAPLGISDRGASPSRARRSASAGASSASRAPIRRRTSCSASPSIASRAGEVDELEDAQRPAVSRNRLAEARSLLVDDHQLRRAAARARGGRRSGRARTLSDASTQASSRRPTTRGRMPSGSRRPGHAPRARPLQTRPRCATWCRPRHRPGRRTGAARSERRSPRCRRSTRAGRAARAGRHGGPPCWSDCRCGRARSPRWPSGARSAARSATPSSRWLSSGRGRSRCGPRGRRGAARRTPGSRVPCPSSPSRASRPRRRSRRSPGRGAGAHRGRSR